MLRLVAPASLFLTLVLVATPAALAGGADELTVTVGPAGLIGEEGAYFVRATLGEPEAPHAASADEDCMAAKPEGRRHIRAAIAEAAAAVLAWDRETLSVSSFFPGCFGGNVGTVCLPAGLWCGFTYDAAYASYDTATGRYFIEVFIPDPSTGLPIRGLLPFQGQRAESVAFAGTTGVQLQTDCETCPPPTCC